MITFNKLPIFIATLLIIATTGGIKELFTTVHGITESSESLQFWVKVIPEAGWKFNTEYPTKVKVKTRGYDLMKTTVSKEEESTAHIIRATVKQNGDRTEEVVKMQANFSVCNDTSCLVYKREYSFCRGGACKE